MIEAVESGSTAERAGLAKGDLVLKIDGVGVNGPEALRRTIGAQERGSTVVLDILRNNLPRKVEVRLE